MQGRKRKRRAGRKMKAGANEINVYVGGGGMWAGVGVWVSK